MALLTLGAAPAVAAPADIDRGFGGTGIITVKGPSGGRFPADAVVRMAIGPEDEVFVLYSYYACEWQFECQTQLGLQRYDAAGKLDASFGGGQGPRLEVHEGPERQPFDLAVGPDGKPVIAAFDSSAGEEGSLRLFRFDRAGYPDTTFGPGGETTQPLRPGYSAPVSIAVQPDGKVVVAVEGSRVDGGQELRIARYSTDGTLDPGFGGSGEVKAALPTQTRPADLLLDPSGAITVAAPYCCVGGTTLFGNGFSLVRVLGNGTPDAGFAGSGQLLFSTPGAEGTVESIALAPGGGTVVLFEERTEAVSTFDNLAKLAPDGSLDGSFGSAGRLRVFHRVDSVRTTTMAVDRQGRVVGGGTDDKLAVFRLGPEGGLDRTFNGGQRVTARFGGIALAIGFQSDGRIVVLGQTGCCSSIGFALFALRGGTDHTRCLHRKATIVGTNRADELTGTPRRDVIAALGGKDTVRGLSGQDLICGGKGQDKLLGGPGRDEVRQ